MTKTYRYRLLTETMDGRELSGEKLHRVGFGVFASETNVESEGYLWLTEEGLRLLMSFQPTTDRDKGYYQYEYLRDTAQPHPLAPYHKGPGGPRV